MKGINYMAGSVNKVILIGNLGQDPELRYMPSGDPVASFSMATTDQFKDKDGNQQKKTEWHKIVAFKRLAEICGEYLKKGSSVYIEGRIQTRNWEDKDGVKRYSTEIIANSMQMLGRKGDTGDSDYVQPPEQNSNSNKSEGSDDDLPF